MPKQLLLVLLLFSPFYLLCQSLSLDRVDKIKSSTVQIFVPGINSTGTGFFIDKAGTIATCWHILDPTFMGNPLSRINYIYIRFRNGDTVEVKMSDKMKKFGQTNGLVYDFCLLSPLKPFRKEVEFYKIGNFELTEEGQEVYTCGYPLGYPQQFISKGIISTKYITEDSNFTNTITHKKMSFPRDEALIDLTMNKGNSGGAIIKIGKSINEDEIIGIADFIVNPLGNKADSLVKSIKMAEGVMNIVTTDTNGKKTVNDPIQTSAIFGEAIGSLSIGISGCISAKYLHEAMLGMWR